MPSRYPIAKKGDIPRGEGRAFPYDDRMIAIFNDEEVYFAIDDFCPHQGASLACGYVENGTVACPWHAWRFRLSDGAWLDNPKIKVDAFPVEIEGEQIYLIVPDEVNP